MRKPGLFLGSLSLLLTGLFLLWSPDPTEARGENSEFELRVAFPNLEFDRPTYITHAPDDTQRLFVLEQHGEIRVFENRASVLSAPTFLDISKKVSRRGNEEGLLGLAFHPQYRKNGMFFVHYSLRGDRRGVVSRFRVDPQNPNRALVDSEEVLLTVQQPYRNHNGGMIEFGPDGYLYLSFGDGGSRGDPRNNGQNLGTLLGAILRIDIDSRSNGAPYSIPADNPFRKGPPGARPEIWAYGLRNVWRFSFDRTTGDLWAGDVGQNGWEEVDLIVGGKNYGWRSYEGFERYDSRTQPLGNVTPPLVVYSPRQGVSITGGYVYRGTRHPELVGQYLFADFESGRIWTLNAKSRKASSMKLLLHPRKNIASFGESAEGELFLCAFDGRIYEIHSPR